MSHHKHEIDGPDFQAEVKIPEGSGDWQAKVRLEDDGQRGKNVVLTASSPDLLAEELGRFEAAFAQTRAKVQELATTEPDEKPSDFDPERPAEPPAGW
jgi:hypothetical protein